LTAPSTTVTLSIALCAMLFLSSGFILDFFHYLDYHIRKKGSVVPKPLKKTKKGYWIVDSAKRTRNFVLLGYLEAGHVGDDLADSDAGSQGDDDDSVQNTFATTCCFLLNAFLFRDRNTTSHFTRKRRHSLRSLESTFSEEWDDKSSVGTDDFAYFNDHDEPH
jgi:hypothetical protein